MVTRIDETPVDGEELTELQNRSNANQLCHAENINNAGDLVAAFIASACPDDYNVTGHHINEEQSFYSIDITPSEGDKSLKVIIEQFGEVSASVETFGESNTPRINHNFDATVTADQMDPIIRSILTRKTAEVFGAIGIDLDTASKQAFIADEPPSKLVRIPNAPVRGRDLLGQLRG